MTDSRSGTAESNGDETLGTALARCIARFRAAGLDEPEADARILLEDATGLTRAALRAALDAPLGLEAAARLDGWMARRLAREPVFRIVGHREFWGLDLRITPAVLDPRPDTETLVRASLAALAPRRGDPLNILDLGTGSGAILLALLSELPRAGGVGLDRSAEACAVARDNAARCGLAHRATIVEGDFATDVAATFDLVVSNPPYIESAGIADLAPEVRDHDPILALDGGPDGLVAYRTLAGRLPGWLAPGGLAALEVGSTQACAVGDLLRGAGFAVVERHRDLGGHDRVVIGRYKA